ncbi:MAG: HPr family phosphocarrier protein [Chitinispirillia bacterium]|nr:HPr family phosphocarrier protein [Chitinispirillia bacterium]MCL2242155.1 HPr family phosphocarrier protein [Chitinispirillia bacterium]
MLEKDVKVINSLGIHARPASMIVQAAVKFKSSVQLLKDGATADAKSIMSVMMLAAAQGSTVTVKADGEDEAAAADAIIALFGMKFNEE